MQGWTGTAYAAELVDDLQLALGEAVANAVEHAYGPDDDGRVRYRITARTDGGLDDPPAITSGIMVSRAEQTSRSHR